MIGAARAAVDAAVTVLRDARASQQPLHRTSKGAKDFLTEVDLASEAAIRSSLAASTPDIGFYGEEGGGADLHSPRVWVADPLDGTVNYATGAPTCGVMLALLEDGVPVLGVIDLPFLEMRVEALAGQGVTLNGKPTQITDVDSLADGIVGMGDAFHRGGARHEAFLDLTKSVHANALRFRSVGAASVLWCWLAAGMIQGAICAHNNPYDVVAGHIVAQEAGAIASDYAGNPLTLESSGAMAYTPGIRPELLALAQDLARAAA